MLDMSFYKISMPTTRRVDGNTKGESVSKFKANFFEKEKYEPNLAFPHA